MVSDEAAAIRQLIDKDQIVDLVHEYSYCVDHRRYDEVVELFTEDCVVDYGRASRPCVLGPGCERCSGTRRTSPRPVTTTRTSW